MVHTMDVLKKHEAVARVTNGQPTADAVPTTPLPSTPMQTFWHKWGEVLKQVLPIYIAVHVAFFVISCVSVLFTMPDFQWKGLPLHTLWQSWRHWDSGHFVVERANHTVLYLSIFPTAFFFAAAYNEALFLCFVLISFYNMRHGRWWLAGIFGFCSGLTRSFGLLLVLPFCYEYLQQHQLNLRKIRFDVVSVILIPAAIMIFGLYCYLRFHDFLAFSHAEFEWHRQLHGTWHGILGSIKAILISSGFLSFQTLRNLLDLGPDLLVGMLIILSFVGPWRLPRKLWSYGIYAGVLYVFLQLFPVGGTGIFPLESMSRYLLEIFPAFIMLAGFAKYRMFHLNYMLVSSALLFFLLTQFLTGHWVL